MIRLPGLIDVHVHMRVPGATHKEDWYSGTAAALAGGITTVLTMPNTSPPITDKASLDLSLNSAKEHAICDYAQYLGATETNSVHDNVSPSQVAGLKMYLNDTFGKLRLDNMLHWIQHLKNWPVSSPVAVHAEKETMAAVILLAALYKRPLHICHVSKKEEILIIKQAKQNGFNITCEVTPHHLFLSESDIPALGPGFSEVRPILATKSDQDALWKNFSTIDCIATDHAPHTIQEKASTNPPPGFPGLETSLPLMLTAVKQNRITLDDLILRMHTNPKRIFNIPGQPDTYIEVDLDNQFEITEKDHFSKCGWTPFEGFPVVGKVKKVTLRGKVAYHNQKILAQPGSGKNIRL